ncbi:ATP-binding cassette domain-containing protein [Streptomyces sp. NPDC001732]
MIRAHELTKRYGDTTVVHGLDFTVRPGTVTGFLGPNGVGKSTTMRMLLGLDAPTRGRSTIGGRSYAAHGASLTAVPRRLPVLWAKAAVFTATVLVVMTTTALLAFLVAQLFLDDTDQAASLGDPGVLRAIVGNAAGTTLLSLIALGLGALLRSVPGAIGAYIGGVMILPEVLSMLPYDAVESAIKYFPTQAAGALGSATPLAGEASPGGAVLALCLWAGAILGAAALLLRRRDA